MKKIFVDMMPLFEKESTRKGSNWMMVEIYAEDRMDDNHVDAIRAVIKKGLRELHEYGQATSIAADAPKRKESTSSSKDDVPRGQYDVLRSLIGDPPWHFTDHEKILWLTESIYNSLDGIGGNFNPTQVKGMVSSAIARGDWIMAAAASCAMVNIERRYRPTTHPNCRCIAEPVEGKKYENW